MYNELYKLNPNSELYKANPNNELYKANPNNPAIAPALDPQTAMGATPPNMNALNGSYAFNALQTSQCLPPNQSQGHNNANGNGDNPGGGGEKCGGKRARISMEMTNHSERVEREIIRRFANNTRERYCISIYASLQR